MATIKEQIKIVFDDETLAAIKELTAAFESLAEIKEMLATIEAFAEEIRRTRMSGQLERRSEK